MKDQSHDASRRKFLKLNSILALGLASGATLPFFSSCADEIPNDANYFDRLRLLREAIQKSSDFLSAKATDIVATKDPKKIFEFVRDNFQTIPEKLSINEYSEKNYNREYYRWGIEGCYRYASGTMYEKAHLLAQLLNDAGLDAKVIYAKTDTNKTNWKEIYLTDFELSFNPDIPYSIFDVNHKTTIKTDIKNEKMDGQEIDGTMKSIINSLPKDFKYCDADWDRLSEWQYEVVLREGEKETRLNPSVPKAKHGESYTTGRDKVNKYQPKFPEAEISLLLANSDDAHKPFEVAQCKIPLNILHKHQVAFGFRSNLDIKDQLLTPRKHQKMLTPFITLQGEKVTEEELGKYSTIGKTIHLNGDVIEATNNGLLINGEKVKVTEENPAARKKVKELEAELTTTNFPSIEIFTNPKDSSGNIIDDLSSWDFELSEDGEPVPFTVRKNDLTLEGKNPKILLCFDLSTSVPERFRGESMVELGSRLVDEFHQENPNTSFKVAWYDKNDFLCNENWLSSKEEIIKELENIKTKTDNYSYLWTALANATTRGADIVAFISDGATQDKLTNDIRATLKYGSPTLLLAAGDYGIKSKELKQMAALTRGKVVNASDTQTAIASIKDFTKERMKYKYTIQIDTSCEGNKTRKLSLKVKDTNVRKDFDYAVPEKSCKPLVSWTGIYLRIKFGYNAQTTRTIAGKIIYDREKNNPTLEEHTKATEAAMFGSYKIIFEQGKPTLSVLLDELIGAKLSQEKLIQAMSKDEESTIQVIEEGMVSFPEKYTYLQHQFAKNTSKQHHTFQNGVDVKIFSLLPRAEDGRLIQKLDILPFSEFRTLHENPRKSFELSLKHSLEYMNLERKNYKQSGLDSLLGKELTTLNWKDYSKKASQLRKENENAWHNFQNATHTYSRRLADNFITPSDYKGFFSLHSNSGTVIAHSLSGAGSGAEEAHQNFTELNNAITVYALIMGRLSAVGPAFAVWVMLEKAKLKWLEKATIAIITMQGMSDEDLRQTLHETICNAVVDAFGSFGGNLADELAMVNDIYGLLGIPTVSDCGVQNLPGEGG